MSKGQRRGRCRTSLKFVYRAPGFQRYCIAIDRAVLLCAINLAGLFLLTVSARSHTLVRVRQENKIFCFIITEVPLVCR
jgi:hypothetical protein